MFLFPHRKLIWMTLFAIAFAMVETAVVIYLRELYYPGGFDFPLRLSAFGVMRVELLRELASMVLLLSVAALTGKRWSEKIGWFLYGFAIWDIFYYVFLYLIVDWPSSFFTWDILFLIPVTWVGPVIAPLINSLTMIILGMVIIWFARVKQKVVIKAWHWLALVAGSIVVVIAYTEDYLQYMLDYFSWRELTGGGHMQNILDQLAGYVPSGFKWWIFFAGVLIHLMVIAHLIMINQKNRSAGYEQLLGND